MGALDEIPRPIGPPGQPDITYAPDHEKWVARAKTRQETEDLPTVLPAGFPQKLDSVLVWDGNTLAESYDWNYVLTPSDLEEIDRGLHHFKCKLV